MSALCYGFLTAATDMRAVAFDFLADCHQCDLNIDDADRS